MSINEEMLAHAYAVHRRRVLNARFIVDNIPPKLDISSYPGFSKLKQDKDTYKALNQENNGLMFALNRVSRTRGAINSFRTPSKDELAIDISRLPVSRKKLSTLEHINMHFGKNLLCVRAEVDTWQKRPLRQDVERMKRKQKQKFRVPYRIFKKYTSNFKVPSNPSILKSLLRPKVWFNLEVKGLRPLGLVIIELYTEAAPLIVLEFVRLCKEGKFENFNFLRIFPGLWVEGAVKLSKDSLVNSNIEYDKRAVDHNKKGVLSFHVDLLKKCSATGFINYSISFKALNVLNGYRVGFGRVVGGFKIIQCMQDYGTKNGKTSKKVLVTKCGWYNEKV